MRPQPSEDRLPAVFDDEAFESDAGRYGPGSRARRIADRARRDFALHGVPRVLLMACQAEGRDGTRLAGAYKLNLPIGAETHSFGMVFVPALESGALIVVYLAFGVRHQPFGSRAPTVYALAHRRRHGRLP